MVYSKGIRKGHGFKPALFINDAEPCRLLNICHPENLLLAEGSSGMPKKQMPLRGSLAKNRGISGGRATAAASRQD
jgi:hypothetical protein